MTTPQQTPEAGPSSTALPFPPASPESSVKTPASASSIADPLDQARDEISAPEQDPAPTEKPARQYVVFTRGRTRRKMLRGEDKKEQKKKAKEKGKKKKKTKKKNSHGTPATDKPRAPWPTDEPATSTKNPDPPAEAQATTTKRGRFRKPKEPAPPVPPKKIRKFRFEDKITPVIGRKRDFQQIIDLAGFNGMGRAPKICRKNNYLPGFLAEGNKNHEVGKAWEWWVKDKFAELGYPREFTPGPMLSLTWVPAALASDSGLAPTEGSGDAEAWETSTNDTPCPPGCTCWDCSPLGRKSHSDTSSPQALNRSESPSSHESDLEFVVPGGPRTWTSQKGTTRGTAGTGPVEGTAGAEGTVGTRRQDTRESPDDKPQRSSRPSQGSIASGHKKAQKAPHQAQSHEVQRLRQLELILQIRNTIRTAQTVTDTMAHDRARHIALLMRGISEPQEGHNAKHWERTREGMKETGLFPTGPPHPPTWTQYVAPENAKSTHPNHWWTLNPEQLALDPMYAEKIGKTLEKFPEVRKWRGVLPPYPVPGKHLTLQGAQFVIPNLDELPKKVLLDYVEFIQQGDIRLRGPSTMKVGYDNELLLLYMEVWNRRCAVRESVLWSMGMATTVGWAGGLVKIERMDDVKKLYPNLASETVKWCALLVKGFCRMPEVVGPRPDVWHHPRYDHPEDRSAWPTGARGGRTSPERAPGSPSFYRW